MYLLNNKADVHLDYLAWFIIALVALVVIIGLIYLFTSSSGSILNWLPF
ncbi:MAG: hypothetical protein HGA85_00500 [Nanoarchaeota archaeon]|nr:hypothetical protein [Nanoarchaeota archaeon]